jgi:solute carrier family 25 protein 14/30
LQANSRDSVGLWNAFRSILDSQGVKGLYRGVGPNIQRAIILTGSQLPSYDQSKHVALSTGYFREDIKTHCICAMFAGLISATTTSPIDVVKSRYMNQVFDAHGVGRTYSSTTDCFIKTLKAEGLHGFYKGWLPQWLRIGPHTIVTFIVLEKLRWLAGMAPV